MRLWSLHPKYLDAKGLVALWRESLLAQKVICGHIRGYRNHPQLERFWTHSAPLDAIGSYLREVWDEGRSRGYRFNQTKIESSAAPAPAIEVAEGQMRYEHTHLYAKLERRDPERLKLLARDPVPEPHPSFVVVPGPIASWERVKSRM